MKRSLAAVTALLLVLSGCSSDGDSEDSGPISLSLAAWSLATTPEFQKLADGFKAAHPDIAVEVKEYDAKNYDTQMIADLAAGKAPDIYVQKNLKNFYTYQNGKQLLDVSDVAAKLSSDLGGLSGYQVDGKTWAIPYRADSWVLYYNKALFDKAGVKHPDGSWTWAEYAATAKELTTKLKAKSDKALGTYQHTWQSTSQGPALAQTAGASLDSGNFGFLKPYYETALDLQAAGAQVGLGDATTNSLTYQAQFGKQSTGMMIMGSWYIATLLSQQAKGDADTFDWGLAPMPQQTKATTGTSATPVTFGDPTGLGINPKISERKIQAAKDFLAYAASPEAAKALAGIGVTPADTASAVDTIFALKGVPTDELSKFTFTAHDTKPENPVSQYTAPLQNILNDLHTAVLSGSKPIDAAITEAQDRAKNEVLK
ncbi:ABC transporter substrate-binding protein [Actinoplanes derwentensis]|uniref:Carbohydrate ABC transporter substrate-binding protein, CUT1 family n=1 Tax=Actinoplanes derwentensis TaxID=113562 RepID=A0A1H1Z4V1_9ACTN|nr:extracellular solute-binding protein [Actinoplanes derwentensis]GID81436.1 sugar ABC transporter substrate-binding protein [Actinoplanes derwentensis]SDT28825.1 carbohydrate ABC transporter substrate-binding protein, CUT1 family [Actinoplanes derwentensis]